VIVSPRSDSRAALNAERSASTSPETVTMYFPGQTVRESRISTAASFTRRSVTKIPPATLLNSITSIAGSM